MGRGNKKRSGNNSGNNGAAAPVVVKTVSAAESESGHQIDTVPARVIFVSSLCHYCKSVSQPTANGVTAGLKVSNCSACRMVKYCCKEHQKKDWKAHKELCTIIQHALRSEAKTGLFQDCCRDLPSPDEWLQIRYNYLQQVCHSLGRELAPFEKEMFLFPVTYCPVCPNFSVCDTCHHHHHESRFSFMRSEEWCSQFSLWVQIIQWEYQFGVLKPLCDASQELEPLKLSDELLQKTIDQVADSYCYSKAKDIPSNVWKACWADVATVPLTIARAVLQHAPELAKQDRITIHLVGAETEFEGFAPGKWETCLMHLFPQVKSLEVVLVGPELDDSKGSTSVLMCAICREQGRQLRVSNKPGTLYHDFRRRKDTAAPNLICAFNCGLYRRTGFAGGDTWAPTIPSFALTDLFLTTAYTETEMKQDIARINTDCPGLSISGTYERNSYRSLRPQRTLINEHYDPLMYKNQFVAIFRKSKA